MNSAAAALPRFAVVGGALAAANLALLWALVDALHWPLLPAYTFSFFALNLAGYALNKVYTFRRGRRWVGIELLRYYGVMALSLAANLALMLLLVRGLGVHYLVASTVVTVALAGVNFVAHAGFTFRRRRVRAPRPLRVLQVSAFFPAHGGGIEAVAGQLASRLAADGVEVHWMAGGAAAEEPPAAPRLRIDRAAAWDPLESRLGLPAPLWGPAALWRLWRAVGRCDVVHLHDYLYVPTLAALVFAALRGRPVVLTQHIGKIPFGSRFARGLLAALNRSLGALALATAHQVVFVGRPVQAHFERFVRFRRPPLLVPNGVDHALYRPAAARAPSPLARLLFVGRFVEKKGLPTLRACADVAGASWTFVGWGPLSPAAWPDGTSPRQVLGRLPPADVAAQYQHADLLVLPSHGEGFPLVVQEALACGTPVLVSSEVFDAFPAVDERCVFHVELRLPDPAAALRARLQALVAQREALAAARAPARALAAQWSWDRCVAGYRRVYGAVLDAVAEAG